MYITASTLDDLLRRVLEKLLKSKNRVKPTRGGTLEETGVLLKLNNPRARLSRTETKGTIFSCLGELLWYLSASNDLQFISYYIQRYNDESEDGISVYGGYGPRFFKMHGKIDQITNVIKLLKKRPTSRRAVIQLFDAADIDEERRQEIPCTCTLQFIIRKGKLHMFTTMRSNDAFYGLPHDVFTFTMIQELLARILKVEVGTYKHFVASLHLYEEHVAGAQKYLEEGWQSTTPMPAMPIGNPKNSIRVLLHQESLIRKGKKHGPRKIKLHHYWEDLIRLLQIYGYWKSGKIKRIAVLKSKMSSKVFNTYIQRRQKPKAEKPTPEQLRLNVEQNPSFAN
jgi:thymidylate synthase